MVDPRGRVNAALCRVALCCNCGGSCMQNPELHHNPFRHHPWILDSTPADDPGPEHTPDLDPPQSLTLIPVLLITVTMC